MHDDLQFGHYKFTCFLNPSRLLYFAKVQLRGYIVKAKGIYYYKCNTKGCNCNKNAESLHEQFIGVLEQYTLKSEPLVPLIKKQMLATYYKLNEEEGEDKASYENRLQEINKNIERQKARLKKEEIPYELYLEFVADYEKEKKDIQDELAKASTGVSNPELCVDFAVTYSLKLASTWRSAGYSDKQKLQFLLFPEGIFYNRAEDRCRTDNVNPAFGYIADLERLSEKNKSRTTLKNLERAAWVAPRVENSNLILQDLRDLCSFLVI
ncbi:MAG: septation ring formation regulator EzrA [Bacteroidota bacterium]|nr:septation ring formation regulator EzrA [Bacteroidota bacterium]